MTNFQLAREKVLELCSEDDYGVWELFSSVIPNEDKSNRENAETSFLHLVEDLINEQKIFPKRKNPTTKKLESVDFDANTLALQLKKISSPDPESFYWFSVSQS